MGVALLYICYLLGRYICWVKWFGLSEYENLRGEELYCRVKISKQILVFLMRR